MAAYCILPTVQNALRYTPYLAAYRTSPTWNTPLMLPTADCQLNKSNLVQAARAANCILPTVQSALRYKPYLAADCQLNKSHMVQAALAANCILPTVQATHGTRRSSCQLPTANCKKQSNKSAKRPNS